VEVEQTGDDERVVLGKRRSRGRGVEERVVQPPIRATHRTEEKSGGAFGAFAVPAFAGGGGSEREGGNGRAVPACHDLVVALRPRAVPAGGQEFGAPFVQQRPHAGFV